MSDFIQDAIDGSFAVLGIDRQKKKPGPLAPSAPVTTEEDATPAGEAFLGSLRKKRQIASTTAGGQEKRKTLG